MCLRNLVLRAEHQSKGQTKITQHFRVNPESDRQDGRQEVMVVDEEDGGQ